MRHPPHRIRDQLSERLAEGRLLLDGAMGSALAASVGGSVGPLDRLNLTEPEMVGALHRAYLAAGADIVRTNTFNAAALALADRARARDCVRRGVELAVAEAEGAERDGTARPRFVGASFGLVHANALQAGQGVAAIEEAFAAVMGAAIEAGADLVFIETVFDLAALSPALSAFAAVRARSGWKVPLIVSASPAECAPTLPSGETLMEFRRAVAPFDPAAIGLNCGFGAQAMAPAVAGLAADADGSGPLPLALYPSAGLPDASGAYPDDAEKFAARVARLAVHRGAALIGGCCGTTPAHIAALARCGVGAARSA